MHATKQNKMGLTNTFKSILKEGGALSFWRGNGLNVVKIAPESALKFMVFENTERFLKHRSAGGPATYLDHFLAGAAGGVISQTAIYPLEVVKTRLASTKKKQFRGILDCAVRVYHKGGVLVFFQGYLPNILGRIPYTGIELCVYQTLKHQYLRRFSGDERLVKPPGVVTLTMGAVATICGQLVAYPFALVRTKMQARIVAERNAGMCHVIRRVVQRDGFLGLYYGLWPNFLRVAPMAGISFLVYEEVRTQLGLKELES